jgi:serine/threonine protein kinase
VQPYIRSVTGASVPADLVQALSERYDLRDILGRGGMATVYMAYDRKHQREVALKVLRPDIAATIGADRFLKEIQIVARMVHPHILPLHDSGSAEGFVYYVTPYIDGGSLRTCMEREGRMAASRAIAIAAPIADALSYAHQLGVLHRDIKPENVLFARTHPIVADFGIAKAVSSATSGAQLTRTGISLGTPGYMSPEQAAGFTDVDARTDVYSLAILVYEMIVGAIPGRWVTEESTRAGRFIDAAATHRPYLSASGSTVEGALVRALALRPEGELAETDFAVLVEEIRITLKEVGQVSQLGRSFSWVLNKGTQGTRNLEIAVGVRNGRTRIIIQENLNNLIGAVFGGIGGGLGGGGAGPIIGGLVGGQVLAPAALGFLIPAWLMVVYGVARTTYHYSVRRRSRELGGLADRLAALASDLIGESLKLPERVTP